MSPEARKITFDEAWDSSIVFLNDEEVERRIDEEIDIIVESSLNGRVTTPDHVDINEIADYLSERNNGLDVILADISLSKEKFMRIITLLRRIGEIPGGFESEWSIPKIKRKIMQDRNFAVQIANLLVDGHNNPNLITNLPRYYREKLNLRELGGESEEKRRLKFKESKIGTYAALKGKAVEIKIEEELIRISNQYGVPYGRGRSYIINTDVDWAIPSTDDPYVLIMVSFQETTSSGQSTKARDMFQGYQRVREHNMRNNENRAFINFVDGGGWLARKNDFNRLVNECHYFLNLHYLFMLEGIVRRHVPESFFNI